MSDKQEKFDDPERAIQYLCAGLTRDHPDATLEIIQVMRNRPRKAQCTVDQAAQILSKACQRFPAASVEYHPENPYGFVGEIRCHGEKTGGQTQFHRHTTDRPRVLVMITRSEGKDVLVGSHRVPGGA